MRYLPGNLTGIYHHAASNAEYQKMLEQMDLPDWMFPTFASEDVLARGNDPVIRGFTGRVPTDGSVRERVMAVPWLAWVPPAAMWGVFLLALYGSVLSLVFIFRRQWMENERLPFPIATVLSSLIEEPEKGHWLNALLRSRLFWWTFAAVFVLHAFNALYAYNPRWPAVPLKFDISRILANPPASYVDQWAKTQTIYFSVIGIACLIEARLSLSLWLFFILLQAAQMFYGSYGAQMNDVMQNDQFFGGLLPYTIAAVWVARHHLVVVGKQMVRGSAGKEAHGRYLPYAAAGWVYVGCMIVQIAWLVAAGCTMAGAIVLALMVGMVFFALMRIVAETGLLYVTLTMNLNLPWQYAAHLPQALATRTNLTGNFIGNLFSGMLTHDVRQTLAVYAANGVAVADRAYERNDRARPAIPFVLCIVAALVIGMLLSGGVDLVRGVQLRGHARSRAGIADQQLGRERSAPLVDDGAEHAVRAATHGTGVSAQPVGTFCVWCGADFIAVVGQADVQRFPAASVGVRDVVDPGGEVGVVQHPARVGAEGRGS